MGLPSLLRVIFNPLSFPLGIFHEPEAVKLPFTPEEQAEELSLLAQDASCLMEYLVDELLCGCPWDGNDVVAERIDERSQRLLVASGGACYLPQLPAEGFAGLYASAPGLAKVPYEDLLGEQKSELERLHASARGAMFSACAGEKISSEKAQAIFTHAQRVISSRGLAPRPYFPAA